MSAITLPTIALSLRQPWAWLVATGLKPIENRRWNTKFRGPFLIHAAKGMTRDEYDDAVDFARAVNPSIVVPPRAELAFMGIVGHARIVDVLPPCGSDPSLFWRPCSHAWHMPQQFGFVLADIQPLPFVPVKGALGFFKVPAEIVARCAA